MKIIRGLTTLLGLSLVLLALGATRAGAQDLKTTVFGGTFTLPFDAQWGPMALPAGDYSLYYGQIFEGGEYAVRVVSKTNRNSRGWILTKERKSASAAKNSLVCMRDGNSLVVLRLELAAIGESVSFPLPHGVEVQSKLIGKHQNKGGNAQLAETRILIQRVPVKLSGK